MTKELEEFDKFVRLNVTGKIVEVLNYTYSPKNILQLTGKWKGKNIQVSLTLSPVDSIRLNKERITLVHPDED